MVLDAGMLGLSMCVLQRSRLMANDLGFRIGGRTSWCRVDGLGALGGVELLDCYNGFSVPVADPVLGLEFRLRSSWSGKALA